MKICWIIGNKEEESILTDSEPLKLPMSDKRQWVKIFIEFVIQLDWLGGWTKPEDLYCENSCYNNDTKGIQRKQVIYSCSFFYELFGYDKFIFALTGFGFGIGCSIHFKWESCYHWADIMATHHTKSMK